MERKIDRFLKYLDYKGITENKATVDCGLSKGLIGQAKNGKSDLGNKAIEKVLIFYQDLNKVWLVTGEGEMLKESSQPKLVADQVPSLSSTELLLRDLLTERDNEIRVLQEIIWGLKEEIGSLKNQLEHKGETARSAGGSSVANAG